MELVEGKEAASRPRTQRPGVRNLNLSLNFGEDYWGVVVRFIRSSVDLVGWAGGLGERCRDQLTR